MSDKKIQEILNDYYPVHFKQEDGNAGNAYDEASVKEMLRDYADQEKRKEALAFSKWKDRMGIKALAGDEEDKQWVLNEGRKVSFFSDDSLHELYASHLQSLPKIDKA